MEGIVYRYWTGRAWRGLPVELGPGQTAWKRDGRFSGDGTCRAVLRKLLVQTDAFDAIDRSVSIDSPFNRAEQDSAILQRAAGRRARIT